MFQCLADLFRMKTGGRKGPLMSIWCVGSSCVWMSLQDHHIMYYVISTVDVQPGISQSNQVSKNELRSAVIHHVRF